MAQTTARIVLFILCGIYTLPLMAGGFDGLPDGLDGDRPSDPRPSDPYWQYYDDCDRWGVRFNSAVFDASVGNDASDLVAAKEDLPPFVESKTAEAKPAESKMAESKMAESKMAESKMANRLRGALFQWGRSTRLVFRDWWEMVEFEAVEARGIDLRALTLGPAQPSGVLVRLGIEARMGRIGESLRQRGVKLFDTSWYLGIAETFQRHVSPSISRVALEVERERTAREFAIRSEMANQLDGFAMKLQAWADSIRPAVPAIEIDDSRESIASNRVETAKK